MRRDRPRFNPIKGIYFSQGRRVFRVTLVGHSSKGIRYEFVESKYLNEVGELRSDAPPECVISRMESEMISYMDEGLISYIGPNKPKY